MWYNCFVLGEIISYAFVGTFIRFVSRKQTDQYLVKKTKHKTSYYSRMIKLVIKQYAIVRTSFIFEDKELRSRGWTALWSEMMRVSQTESHYAIQKASERHIASCNNLANCTNLERCNCKLDPFVYQVDSFQITAFRQS